MKNMVVDSQQCKLIAIKDDKWLVGDIELGEKSLNTK